MPQNLSFFKLGFKSRIVKSRFSLHSIQNNCIWRCKNGNYDLDVIDALTLIINLKVDAKKLVNPQ